MSQKTVETAVNVYNMPIHSNSTDVEITHLPNVHRPECTSPIFRISAKKIVAFYFPFFHLVKIFLFAGLFFQTIEIWCHLCTLKTRNFQMSLVSSHEILILKDI